MQKSGFVTRPLYESVSGRWYIYVDGDQVKVPWRYGRPYKIEYGGNRTIMDYDIGDRIDIEYKMVSDRMVLVRID